MGRETEKYLDQMTYAQRLKKDSSDCPNRGYPLEGDELIVCELGPCWGSSVESMLPFLGRSLGPRRARSHWNMVSSQRVNIVNVISPA
jgi:hypothetical protein